MLAVGGIVYLEHCALKKGIDGIALTAAIGAIAALGGAGAVLLGRTLNIQISNRKKKAQKTKDGCKWQSGMDGGG